MIKKLKYKGKEIILVGTAHISENSVKLVEDTIEEEKPDVVGVELDRARLEQLLSEQKWQETNLTEIVKGGKTYLFLLNVLLSNLQRQIGDNLGIKPGSEMLVAVRKSAKMKIPIQLLDRDVKVTLKRAMDKMSLIEKTKLGYGLIAGLIGVGKKEVITKERIEEPHAKGCWSRCNA